MPSISRYQSMMVAGTTPTPAPSTSNIIAAEIEPNGWVLALTLDGVSAGTFSDYTLSPDASPRLTVTSVHPGFVQSGGEAIAGNQNRTMVGTTPLRLPVNPSAPTPPVIDEEDLGGGQRKVRITLSNFIYATDTTVRLSVANNWRTGEGSATNIVVTNNSTVVAPLPIFRWAWYSFGIESGTFQLSLVVASHHPNGFLPVAGVKFEVTDGTTVKTYWATSLGNDTRAGDNLRCYTVMVDPASATALTTGRLRCDATVYPWIGVSRTTDPAGTKVMTADLIINPRKTGAANPMCVAYDPTGGRYNQWVVLDPTGGSTTASSAMVATTLAGARAVGTKARNVTTALQALYLNNYTIPAANGAASWPRSADGATIILPAGESEYGATAITAGLETREASVRLIGDPDDPDPRANCIVRSNNNTTAPVTARLSMMLFKDCTLRLGQTRFATSLAWITTDNVTVEGKAGFESSTTTPITANTAPFGEYILSSVNSRWWRTGTQFGSAQHRPGIIRGCEWSRTARAPCVLTGTYIGPLDTTVGPSTPLGTHIDATDMLGCEDNIIAYCDIRSVENRAVVFTLPSAAVAGTTYNSQRRTVLLGNVFERINAASPDPFLSIGEGQAVTASYNIIENCTFVGERANVWYNDPPSSDPTINSEIFCNRQANNWFDWNPTKHDNFFDGTYGYRPWLTGGWSAQNGVMFEGNWDGVRAATSPGAFRYFYRGLRSFQASVATAPGVADDRSVYGTNTGQGDYRPVVGSPVLNRMQNSNTDRDILGVARGAGSPAGAYEEI
jgi:hypothetical protein